VLFCLWKFPIHLCNATFEATLLNLWMLRKLCAERTRGICGRKFSGGICSGKPLCCKSLLRKPEEYAVENLISNVDTNVVLLC